MTGWASVGHWFADHGEAIITLIVGAILGILCNWYFFRRGEKPKLLVWEQISKSRIISASEDQRKHLVVSYKGQQVGNPYVLVLRFLNVGKQEIRNSDLTQPISADFGDVPVVAFEPTSASSDKIKGAFTVGGSREDYVQYTDGDRRATGERSIGARPGRVAGTNGRRAR